ncbi:MAG: TonB family protein [Pseudomonas sp.]
MTQTRHKLSSWAISLLLVLGLHIGLGVWALYWHAEAVAVELPPPAMLIELPPLPEVAPPPAPAQVVEPTPEPQPEVVEAPKPKLVIEKPKPKPKPKPPEKPVEPPKPQEKPVEQTAPQERPSPPAAAAPAAPQPSSTRAPSEAKVTWQSKLLSHLARHKRYPDDARRRGFEGTSRIRFSVDSEGKVLSVAMAGTSGSASLDRATLAMIRRAQPLPKPPAELLSGGSVEVTAPFVYSLDRR